MGAYTDLQMSGQVQNSWTDASSGFQFCEVELQSYLPQILSFGKER